MSKIDSYIYYNNLLNLLRRLNCISLKARAEAQQTATMSRMFSEYVTYILNDLPGDKEFAQEVNRLVGTKDED